MKPLNINFGETQSLRIDDLSEVSGTKKTDIGRAAMQLGLMQLQSLLARDLEKGRELVIVNSAKGKM